MRVLLIGGNGFIGAHLINAFQDVGIDTSVLDRADGFYKPSRRNVRTFLGEYTNIDLVQRAMEGADVIIYLASTSVPLTSANNPEKDVTGNLVPFFNYMEIALQQKIKRIILFSSGGTVYGVPSKLPVTEEHPTQPIVSHGIVKLMMEKYLFTLAYNQGLESVILRVGNAYGEGQNPYTKFGAIATFLGCFATRRPITLWGSGDAIRDYIYVKDIASACVAALGLKTTYSIFNIGTNQGHSLNSLIEMIADITNVPAPEVHREEHHSFDVPRIILDNTLAKQQMGWEPQITLADGIKNTWEWVRSLQ